MPFDESAYQKVRCTSDTPVIRMSQGQKKKVQFTLRDEKGDAVDLDALTDAADIPVYDGPEFMSSSSMTQLLSSSFAGLVVRLSATHFLCDGSTQFEVLGTITDANMGEIEFQFLPDHTNTPGIFVASVGVFFTDILRFQQMIYLEFMPTNFSLSSQGPITVPEVRMDIMDMCPDANYLLDELEFTDAEIIHCMRKAVDTFNETPPRVLRYTPENFPFRAAWLGATSGFLLRMVSHRYRRNTLRYSAAGVTVADQERAEAYERAANQAVAEFKDWSQQIQVARNISLAYGSIAPSPYRRGYYGSLRW